MRLDKYAFIGPEGNGVILTVSQTVEGDQVEISIQRANRETMRMDIQTIRLDEDTFRELCDLKYRGLFFEREKKEAPTQC